MKNLEAYLPNKGRAQILDVGCGDGLFFSAMAHLGTVPGIDPYVPGIFKQHQDRILKIDFLKKDLPRETYDALLRLTL